MRAGDAVGDVQAFTPTDHLVAQAQVEVVPAQVPAAVYIGVEQTYITSVLVDGLLGKVLGT
ncbi:hypothetical protein D3C84_1186970 [compost metagenome]